MTDEEKARELALSVIDHAEQVKELMEPTIQERLRDIEGYEGLYQVSDQGRVYSIPRKRTAGGWIKPVENCGYLRVSLGGKYQLIHRIVMRTFIGPCPDGMEVSHKNGNAHDNRLENLEYTTPTRNQQMKRKHGTHLQGENTPSRKLDWSQVCEIRHLKGKVRQVDLADRFGVARSTIQRIQGGETWKFRN